MAANEAEIRSIVQEVLGIIDLVALQDCQKKLQETIEQNRRLEQNFNVYHELAERRGEQSEQLKQQILELENKIILLTSAIENLTNATD
ncbi:MAG: hypothetical protein H6961_10340 [Chromatiaceae bacterium]|nr:hypothetical protein [Chromatiaceae bacterium]